jgi:hypothetical protein
VLDNNYEKTEQTLNLKSKVHIDRLKELNRTTAMRMLDMQGVLAQGLAGPQQAVNNAENYPSTWTTNPDGGANGQV